MNGTTQLAGAGALGVTGSTAAAQIVKHQWDWWTSAIQPDMSMETAAAYGAAALIVLGYGVLWLPRPQRKERTEDATS